MVGAVLLLLLLLLLVLSLVVLLRRLLILLLVGIELLGRLLVLLLQRRAGVHLRGIGGRLRLDHRLRHRCLRASGRWLRRALWHLCRRGWHL